MFKPQHTSDFTTPIRFFYSTKSSELTDHLGNVRATFQQVGAVPSGTVQVTSWQDYYAFGSVMPGRHYSAEDYAYGYQGQEDCAGPSKWKNFELRQLNTDLGRWMAPDPYGQFHSPYISMGNIPNMGVDPDGGYMIYDRQDQSWVALNRQISLMNYAKWGFTNGNGIGIGMWDGGDRNGSIQSGGHAGGYGAAELAAELAMESPWFSEYRTYLSTYNQPFVVTGSDGNEHMSFTASGAANLVSQYVNGVSNAGYNYDTKTFSALYTSNLYQSATGTRLSNGMSYEDAQRVLPTKAGGWTGTTTVLDFNLPVAGIGGGMGVGGNQTGGGLSTSFLAGTAFDLAVTGAKGGLGAINREYARQNLLNNLRKKDLSLRTVAKPIQVHKVARFAGKFGGGVFALWGVGDAYSDLGTKTSGWGFGLELGMEAFGLIPGWGTWSSIWYEAGKVGGFSKWYGDDDTKWFR